MSSQLDTGLAPASLGGKTALCFADSDSFLKWGASIADQLPADWTIKIAVLHSNATPSERQQRAAIEGTRFEYEDLVQLHHDHTASYVARLEPDVIIAAARGFTVQSLLDDIVPRAKNRPVVVSGLPGISLPVLPGGIRYRASVDLFILHSKNEVAEYERVSHEIGIPMEFDLATLPFLSVPTDAPSPQDGPPSVDGDEQDDRDEIVFATQAKVPREREHRIEVLRWLAQTATNNPHRRVVIKVRSGAGEPQTHPEQLPYPDLLEELERDGEIRRPDNLTIEHGAMADHLRHAVGLATVSSTALVEAIASQVPVIALSDFGVSEELINTSLVDSGLLARSPHLVDGMFRLPHESWLDDNYFHDEHDNTWRARLISLLAQREHGELPPRRPTPKTFMNTFRRAYYLHQAHIPTHPSLGYRIVDFWWESLFAANRVIRAVRRLAKKTVRTARGE